MTLDEQRSFVRAQYDGKRWHERVAKMPADQITALYIKFRAKPEKEATKVWNKNSKEC